MNRWVPPVIAAALSLTVITYLAASTGFDENRAEPYDVKVLTGRPVLI
ncbi:MAG: hypothetical protein QXF45_01470 [Candidatus Caldarchaeum sp.]